MRPASALPSPPTHGYRLGEAAENPAIPLLTAAYRLGRRR